MNLGGKRKWGIHNGNYQKHTLRKGVRIVARFISMMELPSKHFQNLTTNNVIPNSGFTVLAT